MPQRIQAAKLVTALESYRIAEQRLFRSESAAGLPRTERDALALVLAAEGTDEPMTPGVLATRLGFTTPAVSNLLHRMEDAGLIAISAHPADRRRKIIATTADGQAACDAPTTVPPVRDYLMNVPDDQAEAVRAFLEGLSTVISSQSVSKV